MMKSLLERAKAGDKESEERLFQELLARFRTIARRKIWEKETADDAAQEACTIVFQKYRTESIRGAFDAWAYGVIRMTVNRYLHSVSSEQNRFVHHSEQKMSEYSPVHPRHVLERKLIDCLSHISQVNPRYARILNLSYQGYTTEDICDRLKISRSALYSVLCRSRALLKKCLRTGKI